LVFRIVVVIVAVVVVVETVVLVVVLVVVDVGSVVVPERALEMTTLASLITRVTFT
jgi:hypothetical protein